MESFLKDVAKDLYNRYGERVSDITLIFPGKRVSLFFLRHLAAVAGKPMWSPKCLTIQELMQHISGKLPADPLQLIFDLHSVYQKESNRKESFDDFYFWGEMLLSDFDDIDKYLVNAEDLFQNLATLKTYENLYHYLSEDQIATIQQFWNSFTSETSGEIQGKFLSVWSILYPVYRNFKDKLLSTPFAYEGMIYREVAEMLEQKKQVNLPAEQLAFIGFNALNSCEQKLFNFLKNQGQAHFYWDFDPSYMNDKAHQAGYFLRKNIKRFPMPDSFYALKKPFKEPEIKVYATGSDVAQVKKAGETLHGWAEKDEINEETAFILADESLLQQSLFAIPENVQNLNITMGLSMGYSQAYNFLDAMFILHQYTRIDENDAYFYYRPVLKILQHPFVLRACKKEAEELVSKIRMDNLVHLKQQDIPEVPLLQHIFSVSDPVFDRIRTVFIRIIEAFQSSQEKSQQDKVELEFLVHLYSAFNRIDGNLREKDVQINAKTLRRMVHKVIRNVKVPFSGEPLSGLQVMGLLETRAIDFKNIVIVSFNEGIYPKTSASPSYVPYNLRKGFGLPTLEHQDSIFAYYFYRLLHRAEKVELFYNTKTDGLNSGERSRFLHQLIYIENHRVEEVGMTMPLSSFAPVKVEILQSKETLDILRKFNGSEAKMISPSALNLYLDCSLKFYFKYIAGIPEKEEVSEEVDPAIFGNILHDAMQDIYEQLPDGKADENSLKKFMESDNIIEGAVDRAFKQNYAPGQQSFKISGNNIIVKSVICGYVRRIIEVDLNHAPFEIVHLENEYRRSIPLSSDIKEVVIGGKIDRVDQKNGTLRIIDYKTGKAEHGFLSIPDLFDKENFKRNKAVFQTFFYAYLMDPIEGSVLQPALYPVKNIFQKEFSPALYQSKDRKKLYISDFTPIKPEFEEQLMLLLSEIFSPDARYKQTEEQRFCEYCTYKSICRK